MTTGEYIRKLPNNGKDDPDLLKTQIIIYVIIYMKEKDRQCLSGSNVQSNVWNLRIWNSRQKEVR